MYTSDELIFVEVKVIDHMQDISEYLTPRKLSTLRRTIDAYLHDYPSEKQISLDVLFVQDDQVAEWYRNVTNN
jgi:Holliday junction resolvase-like predicted endonuclease